MVGESFEPTGMVVEALYTGEVSEEIQADWTPKEPLQISDKFVLICYQDKAVMLPICVKENNSSDSKVENNNKAIYGDYQKVSIDSDDIQLNSEKTKQNGYINNESIPNFYPSSFVIRFDYPPDDFAF